MKKIFSYLKIAWLVVEPPPQWRLPVMVIAGFFAGIALALIRLSEATSYLSDKPETCMNCHVMGPSYVSWEHSNHASVATCNDCHVPQNNLFMKYLFKGMDGSRHSFLYTFKMESQAIMIKDAGMSVVQQNCIRCHGNTVHLVSVGRDTLASKQMGEGRLCIDCHRDIPHGTVRNLSTFPYARLPKLKLPIDLDI